MPKAAEEQDIAEIIAGYATVAGHCARGGFDGIELQCSGSSIVRGFLSSMSNLRTDGYGGSLERRARLLLEILSAVRDTVGRELAIGVRLCGDERVDPGTTISDAVAIARMVEAQGCADYLNNSIGPTTATPAVLGPPKRVPPGHAGLLSATLRAAISLPVVGAGRYREPAQAERALRAGHCDLVGIVRAQIADPLFAGKALSGRTESIHVCASCTHECVGRVRRNCWLRCTENPRTGREADPGPGEARVPASPRTVVVAGAGPAGLQAAIAAAAGGHKVIVFEKATEPGGLVRLAAAAPGRGAASRPRAQPGGPVSPARGRHSPRNRGHARRRPGRATRPRDRRHRFAPQATELGPSRAVGLAGAGRRRRGARRLVVPVRQRARDRRTGLSPGDQRG